MRNISPVTKRTAQCNLGVIIYSLLSDFIQIYVNKTNSAAISVGKVEERRLMLVLDNGLECEVRRNGYQTNGTLVHIHGEGGDKATTSLYLAMEGSWEFIFSNGEVVKFSLKLNSSNAQKEFLTRIHTYINLFYQLQNKSELVEKKLSLLLGLPRQTIIHFFKKRIGTAFEDGSLLFSPRMLSLIAASIRSRLYVSHRGIGNLIDHEEAA